MKEHFEANNIKHNARQEWKISLQLVPLDDWIRILKNSSEKLKVFFVLNPLICQFDHPAYHPIT